MYKSFKTLLALALLTSLQAAAVNLKTHISLKTPGCPADTYVLTQQADGQLTASAPLPVQCSLTTQKSDGDEIVTLTIKATQTAYFNFGAEADAGMKSADVEFYLPGFWYHRNLRSPREAPSFHTSKSWNFRVDRLSSPLASAYSAAAGRGMSVAQTQCSTGTCDALTTHTEGETILDGPTSVGYVGFDAEGTDTRLTFGFPYVESPRRYIRKLTLAPAVEAFMKIDKGQSLSVTWRIHTAQAADFGAHVQGTWQYCYDLFRPQPLTPLYTPEQMKAGLSKYFSTSFANGYKLKFNSAHGMRCDDCAPTSLMQVGFVGRVLINAFNAIEYGEEKGMKDIVENGRAVFDSFLENGFTSNGYLYEDIDMSKPMPADKDVIHSIRRQSEGVYAVLHYLNYERRHGRTHKQWEARMRTELNNFVALLKTDGSYARKFHDDGTDIDASGGSTPSATSALIMGYKYFGDKRYLAAAKRTVDYLEKNIISKSDYFSSTLDANCEDKEAAISAVTATYYLAMVTKGREAQHYTDLCRRAAYFALSWYYLWDLPFAQGQMLGDLGFKSRGWGNVSVENNHIDVFVFELPHIVKWLAEKTGEQRFAGIYSVISSSLCQLLPVKGRMCGIAKEGYYPEVVQHTTWDYGKNGKGFYNDIFAPGWTVASLWELYSPTRTQSFLTK